MLFRSFVGLVFMLASLQVYSAVDPYEFSSEEDRKRYKVLAEELRCPKCKNNNLAGTNSQIAVDLRRELKKMVVAGDSDEQIIDFMVSRYGDFVLYRPRMKGKTLYVWLGPVVLLIISIFAVSAIVLRRRRIAPPAQSKGLTADEETQLQAILGEDQKK